ncbi:hypothetical protein ACS0TY_016009 [Phlomoides rotata]
MATSTVAERARIVWTMRLSSAIRSAFASAIVGGVAIFGPKCLARQIRYPSFAYLTAFLVVSDASLGDTIKGCWHAICATLQVVPIAMLWWWIIGPMAGLPPIMAAVTVAVAAFLVALPEFTHLTVKKIAFGQIVLVCTDAVVKGGSDDRFMKPLHIASATALGALASILAWMIREMYRVYAENATQRMNIYLRAFMAANEQTKMELISQAKPLSETGDKLLQSIKILQGGIRWETPWRRVSPRRRLERMELQMRGMEYSLLASAFPIQKNHEEQLSNLFESLSARLTEKIQQVSCFSPSNSMIESETREFIDKPSLPLDSTFPINKQRWVFFYFSCIDMVMSDTFTSPNEFKTHCLKTEFSITRMFKSWIQTHTSHERLKFSLKCSLSLSLAVLCGLLFDKDNGCWAGLTIAISFVTGRQAIFTMANARAQGTAIGSVYGVICCFLFNSEAVRLVAILPWIIITSFLRYSKMYGQTMGTAAATGALLILGRKNFGAPDEFAMARLTEVFIGLLAFIVVELFLQPFRATTLAKNNLFTTLHTIQDYIKETGTCLLPKFLETREKQKHINSLICELKELVADAEVEPDFWYLPFRTSCYQKLVKSLSNITDLLHFITYNFKIVSELLETTTLREEFQEQINDELELLQETLKQATSTISPAVSQEALDWSCIGLEAGVLQSKENLTVFITEQKEAEGTTQDEDTEENKLREIIMRHMSATGFCISSILKELKDIEICLRELHE